MENEIKEKIGDGGSVRVASDDKGDMEASLWEVLSVLSGCLPECRQVKESKWIGFRRWVRKIVGKIRRIKKVSNVKTTRTVEINANLGNYNSIKIMSCVTKGHEEMSEEAERARAKNEWIDLALDVRRALSTSLITLGRNQDDEKIFIDAVKARVADKLALMKAEKEAPK